MARNSKSLMGENNPQVHKAEDNLTIEVPADLLDEAGWARFDQIVRNYEPIIKLALNSNELLTHRDEAIVSFSWSGGNIDWEDSDCLAMFVVALIEMAKRQRRVLDKPADMTNPKFTMRTFLNRLGFTGPEYKRLRHFLTYNLPGNSAWKNGAPTISSREEP